MLYVINDIHGDPLVSKKVADFILDSFHGDSLIINGDFAGTRGPVLSELARYYYAANNKVCSCHDVREVLKKNISEQGSSAQMSSFLKQQILVSL